MNAFLALVRKDLYLHFSNRRAVLMSIIAPILIAAFFGSLFGGKGGGSSKASPVPIAISDLDHSPLTAKISAALQADTSLAVQSLDADAALAQVKAGKLRAAIVLPAGFGEQAGRALFAGPEGKRPEITLHYDPSQAMVLPMVRGLLAQHVMQLVSADTFSGQGAPVMKDMRAQVADNTALPAEQRQELTAMFDSIARVQERSARAPQAGASAASAADTGRSSFTMSPPFSTRELEASAKADVPYNSYAHSFAGMGVQFILMMAVDIGVALLLMRRQGLWQRLRAAPLSKARLLGSRIASCTLISLIIFVLIYAVAIAAFGVRVQGSWLGFAAVLLAFSLLTASFGLLIAALGKSPEATRGLAILATLLMVMLGGAWVPSFVFPEWLQTASLFIPTRWAVDGLDAMTWRGLPFSEALAPVGVMLGFALAFGALAIARFSWEE
ncbi:ABC transporter permease [Paucibacter sp. DJ2R-2]|uniref:ABC transporter permease n=1 Tax=Paucibacter sp. DJ2R-2 TaxID=2893558 RepID=UPI0021E3B985|nr:ABC transporter permease [Paucibacter sp. DJ2R-2]MCV2421134.1 ABC transporter permease [Paucibacter sp. DJ4R-1]MCV2439112.1 ABC transporter permease [Paucibacter sp. DJ2R-2]